MKILFQTNYYKFADNNSHKALPTKSNAISNVSNYDKISFASIPANLYFVRMSQYKTNSLWNNKMSKATEIISSMIQKKADAKEIIHMAEYCIRTINGTGKTKKQFGVRKNILGGCIDLINNPEKRGYEYLQRYRKYLDQCPDNTLLIPKSNQTYKQAITCRITANPISIAIMTGKNNPSNIKTNLELVKKAYTILQGKKSPTKKEIVDTAATIQWLIAQETPYMRGSDSVANLLTRSLLHSYGIELSPLKKGVSCDFEAFYRDLDDYIRIYPTLFEKNLLT